MLANLEIGISNTFGWLQVSVLIKVFHSALVRMCMHEHTKCACKHKYVQIISVLLDPHLNNRVDICVLMMLKIVYISWNT